MLNFYHLFLKDKATVAEPHQNVPLSWEKEQKEAFIKLKLLLSANVCLALLILTCDASPYSVGIVMSYLEADGKEVPNAFHSRTSTYTERNFAKLDQEALAIITGVRKFHNYILVDTLRKEQITNFYWE
ncbi:hypothetical protein JTB14_004772 [Gonioctena quinquepunctata]|nr:hypothetical protein JTB14_004772 [Gonioctena quinquepunctata]